MSVSFSVCVREQTRELRPTAGPEAGSETAGSLRAGGGESGSAADGSGLSGLRVPTQSAAGMPAEPRRWRRGGQRYAQVFNAHNRCSLTTNTLPVMKYCCVSLVRTDGGTRLVKLPSASSAGCVLRFLELVCRHLLCDNLFSSQPFSPHSTYDRGKSGTFMGSDWPQYRCLIF